MPVTTLRACGDVEDQGKRPGSRRRSRRHPVAAAMDLSGGWQATRGLALEAIYRDAKIGEIYEGANEVQKWIIARKIFGRDMMASRTA